MYFDNFHGVEKLLDLSSSEMEQVQGGAQVDYFLKIKTVEGEATSSHTGGGHGAGKVSMRDFSF
jgi:hypothetical protein